MGRKISIIDRIGWHERMIAEAQAIGFRFAGNESIRFEPKKRSSRVVMRYRNRWIWISLFFADRQGSAFSFEVSSSQKSRKQWLKVAAGLLPEPVAQLSQEEGADGQ